MWKIEVPPKIKIFLLRVGRNCIPCRKNLQARRMSVPICCALGGSVIENTWHLFIDCLYAQNCWTITNVQIVAECATQSESFTQWLFNCMDRCNAEGLQSLAMILWSIWKYRNDKLWNAVDQPVRVNISLASDQLQQWQTGRKSPQAEHAPTMPSAE